MARPKMHQDMRDRLNPRPTPAPLPTFDETDAKQPGSAQALMPLQPVALHKDVILMSLLRGWCEANGKSISKNKRLYKRMLAKLIEYKILPRASVDAIRQCKPQYERLLATLATWSMSSSSEDSIDGGKPRAVLPFGPFMLPPDSDQSSFFNQRYKKDFIEKKTIGRGGFGKVYEAEHILDGKDYAIKKIKVKKSNLQSIQREIQTLAGLNHTNVVRYHHSWYGVEVHKRSRRIQKQLLMLTNPDQDPQDEHYGDEEGDDEDYYEEEEEEEEDENSYYDKSDWANDVQGEPSASKPKPTSPVITELESDTKEYFQSSMSVKSSKNVTFSNSPLKRADFDVDVGNPFEEERFNSDEMVKDFFKQTSENMAESMKVFSSTQKEEEVDTSSSGTIVFQNSDADVNECETFSIPSLRECVEQNNTPPNQHHSKNPPTYADIQANLNLSDSSVEEINITSKKDKFVEKTFVYSTNNNMLSPRILHTRSSSSTVTEFHSTTRLGNTEKQAQRRMRCQRSISWDGQESSPDMNTGFWRSTDSLEYEHRGYLYIQMELCCGTLRHWMNKRNEAIKVGQNQFDAVRKEENQSINKQIIEGLNYIHSKGILHRDMTPKNIFLSHAEGSGHHHVKIGDFGLAREDAVNEPKTPLSRKKPNKDPLDCSLSCGSDCYTSGVGTTTYAAPEQLDGTSYGNKADMYSVGLIMFEMYHPFRTGQERAKCLEELKEGSIPDVILRRWPSQHSAMRQLTRQNSDERPSASDLLQGDLFPSKKDTIIAGLEDENRRLKAKAEKVTSQEEEIKRLTALLAAKDSEINQLKDRNNSKPAR